MTQQDADPELDPGFARFDSYYDNNPLCCPTRATLLTGLYSHHTGVETNLQASRFDDSSTLATWLRRGRLRDRPVRQVPQQLPVAARQPATCRPGWDRWAAFTPDASYYDYTLVGEQGTATYGDEPADYSTDVLAGRVDEFIRGADQPFFAWFAPYAPHAPRTPAPRDQRAFADARVSLPRELQQGGRRGAALVGTAAAARAPRRAAGHARPVALAAGGRRRDRALRRDAARAGRARRHGDPLPLRQRLLARLAPQSVEGLRLRGVRPPAAVDPLARPHGRRAADRGAGREHGHRADDRRARRRDADRAGRRHQPRAAAHGRAQLAGPADPAPPRPLRGVAPTFWGLRTERWTYVEYRSGERELYDDEADPHQLRNLAGRRGFSKTERTLHRELSEMRAR